MDKFDKNNIYNVEYTSLIVKVEFGNSTLTNKRR